MSDVTRILSQIEQGDPLAAEKLLPLVYDELRKLAAVKLAQEKLGHWSHWVVSCSYISNVAARGNKHENCHSPIEMSPVSHK